MYLQDSNALLLMFLSYFIYLDYYKWFGYNFDILIIGTKYLLTYVRFFDVLMYMVLLRKTEYNRNVWLILKSSMI